MSMLDPLESDLAAREIITRSDYAPTDYERYGQWAQKFYGRGYHQHFKDAEMAMVDTGADIGEDAALAVATRH